ncbi:MAG: CpcT/CpeT family chromophore lyase [Phycisphaerales bacterium]
MLIRHQNAKKTPGMLWSVAAAAMLALPICAAPSFADAVIEEAEFAGSDSMNQVAQQLIGTWKTTSPYQTTTNEDGELVDSYMMMSLASVEIEGMENTMYVESVLSSSQWEPYKQSIFQLYEYKGKVRLRTYTMAINASALGLFSGMTAAPEQFVGITKDQLIPTQDVELDLTSNGFSGSTPYPYPTSINGAVEMTSSMTFDGTILSTSDRGYDAEGNIVWGDTNGGVLSFERADPYAVAQTDEQGLVIIDYPATFTSTEVKEGDGMHVHYYGYMTDGSIFDTSYSRGVPFVFTYPPGRSAIEGWGLGMEGYTLNARRKLIIPSPLGYKERGNPRAGIPGGSTLVFNLHLSHLDLAPEEPENPEAEPVIIDSVED